MTLGRILIMLYCEVTVSLSIGVFPFLDLQQPFHFDIAFLALPALLLVLADLTAAALGADRSLLLMDAYLGPSAVLAVGSQSIVRAELRALALLALPPLPPVLAYLAAPAVYADRALLAVVTERGPSTGLALALVLAVAADLTAPALPAHGADPAVRAAVDRSSGGGGQGLLSDDRFSLPLRLGRLRSLARGVGPSLVKTRRCAHR